jgi:hypothetical protein
MSILSFIWSFLLGSPLEQARHLWHERSLSHCLQTLVYVAIGSYSHDPKPDNEHQEWPLWLQNFHSENPEYPIRIILVDPEYTKGNPNFPFQLSSIQQTQLGHVLEAKKDIQVMVVPVSIDMDRESQSPFNIVAFAQELSRICAENPDRFMMVMDAFTGHNMYEYRSSVSITTPNTFLLGGEHNRDSGCFRDFSQPGTSPIIVPVPGNVGQYMFLIPENVDDKVRSRIMNLTPSSHPSPTFAELSLRKWIEGMCVWNRRFIVGELTLLLRMFAKIEKNVEIADSLDNIERSLKRCIIHRITAQGPHDVYNHIKRLTSEVARHYAKNMLEFEVEIDTLIMILTSELDIHKYGEHVNKFFDTHFPRYSFA